jgi:hypothetical protein
LRTIFARYHAPWVMVVLEPVLDRVLLLAVLPTRVVSVISI